MSSIRVSLRTVGGVRTRVLSVGRRPRVVLLHGFGDSADTWRGVLADFAERGLAAMAVDLPGFGEADDLAPGPILPQLDAFLADLVTGRGGPVVLVGNSMGGTAALRAAQNPGLPLAGVVSIAAPGLHDSWMLRALDTNALPVWLYSALPVPAVAVRTVASAVIPRILYARPGSACPDTVARFADLVRDDQSTKALLVKGRTLLSELRDAYRPQDIRCPLTVVVGRKDKLVATQSGKRLHAEVPHSELRVLDDCGHCPQLDDPAGTADLIADFASGARERTLVS
ncbi:alpha/beta fold hydrolase [Alloactinosynnema sp. L-07]|uniref:alpha/beta fold hydrolase n=1 Tax=Alloactinosynnema sp. L-07 TaxID=1653480 RepID=UPI0008332CBD|nr:alpha/beta hydrolase [Alloactinosynnema sp. L-07]